MNKISKVLMTSAIAITVLSPQQTYAADDVSGHYFESSIRTLITQDIMGGYEDGTFKPNREVTRAEFTAFLVRALSLSTTSESLSFSDVKEGKWYYSAVTTATGNDLIGGYPDGTFRPNNQISRQEMAAMIKRALDYAGVSASEATLTFDDNNKINPMFKPAIQQLVYLNLLAGKEDMYGNVYFAPHDITTRGETAAILNRMLNVIDNPKEIISYTAYSDYNKMIEKQAAVSPKVDGAGKYIASSAMVEYYANPSNFKKGTSEYLQFLVLSESTGLKEDEINTKVLSNKGTLAGLAAAFIQAGNKYNINEVYLIAHALHETDNGTSSLAKGIEVGLDKDGNPTMVTSKNKDELTKIKTTYNMFGIGAVDANPNKFGSERAYKEEWFSPSDAIIGGAQFIGDGYVNNGQDTLYKMKWNPENPGSHQYATHVMWATIQTKQMHNIYSLLDNYVLKFDVPKYSNQAGQTTKPTGIAQYAVNKALAGETGTVIMDNLNFRSGPTTSFGSLAKLPIGTAFTVIGENGGWYKIDVNGTVGWVSSVEPGNTTVKYIQLDKDAKKKVAAIEVAPEEAAEISEEEVATTVEAEEIIEEAITEDATIGAVGETTTDEVPLRSEPGNTNGVLVLQTLPAQTKVEIVDTTDGWYKVMVEDIEGWISDKFVEVK